MQISYSLCHTCTQIDKHTSLLFALTQPQSPAHTCAFIISHIIIYTLYLSVVVAFVVAVVVVLVCCCRCPAPHKTADICCFQFGPLQRRPPAAQPPAQKSWNFSQELNINWFRICGIKIMLSWHFKCDSSTWTNTSTTGLKNGEDTVQFANNKKTYRVIHLKPSYKLYSILYSLAPIWVGSEVFLKLQSTFSFIKINRYIRKIFIEL